MADRLYRSRTDRILFGVAGGVAERLAVDPSLVRIAWILLAFAGGFGFLLYIVMAFVVPEAPETGLPGAAAAGGAAPDGPSGGGRQAPARRHDDGRGLMLFGLILVLIGGWFLVRQWIPFVEADAFGPAVLILIGAVLLFGALRRS